MFQTLWFLIFTLFFSGNPTSQEFPLASLQIFFLISFWVLCILDDVIKSPHNCFILHPSLCLDSISSDPLNTVHPSASPHVFPWYKSFAWICSTWENYPCGKPSADRQRPSTEICNPFCLSSRRHRCWLTQTVRNQNHISLLSWLSEPY